MVDGAITRKRKKELDKAAQEKKEPSAVYEKNGKALQPIAIGRLSKSEKSYTLPAMAKAPEKEKKKQSNETS